MHRSVRIVADILHRTDPTVTPEKVRLGLRPWELDEVLLDLFRKPREAVLGEAETPTTTLG